MPTLLLVFSSVVQIYRLRRNALGVAREAVMLEFITWK